MSIVSTPPLGPTGTFQVGTPFSYSFIYSDPTIVSDEPVYYFNSGITSGNVSAGIIGLIGRTTGYGLEYTISNMTAGQQLNALLPIFIPGSNTYTFSGPSNYLTFGGPTPLTLAGSTNTQFTATFGGFGPFEYEQDIVVRDSLRYTILAPVLPATIPYAFSIKLIRSGISNCACTGVRFESNVLTVISVTTGQVNVGMVFDPQNADPVFTVTGFVTGFGGAGTYTVTSVPDMGSNVYSYSALTSTTVLGSGDVLLSASTTPVTGTAKFELETNVTALDPPLPNQVGCYELTLDAPDVVTVTYPNMSLSTLSSPEWSPFVNGNGTAVIVIDAPNGFRFLPTTNPLQLKLNAITGATVVSTFDSSVTIDPIIINVVPTLESSLSISNYVPFNYSFSIPDTVIDVTLNSTGTSSALLPYFSVDRSSFSSDIGFTSGLYSAPFSLVPKIGTSIVGPAVTSLISSTPLAITMTPNVPSRSLALYLYEPFSYVFKTNPDSIGITLQFSRSSSKVASYCTLSADGSTVTYAGSYLSTSSSVLSLIVDLMYAGSIVSGSTTTVLISVGKGRFFPPASNQNYQLYQYENVSTTFGSNPEFVTVSPIDSITSGTSLPNGLSLELMDSNTCQLKGTPTLQTPQRSYTIFGSNSTTGRIVSVPILIKVNPQQVRITPSSLSRAGMLVDNMIEPQTFVATEPTVVSRLAFLWTWDSLPDGIGFYDMSNNPISYGYSGSNSIQLMGTPTLAAAISFASSNLRSYPVRLYGTQYQGGGINVSGSSLITFSFAETVLFSSVTIPPLYATEDLGYKNVTFEAATYFASGSPILSITAASLPLGISLSSIVQVGTTTKYKVTLIGTPTVVDEAGTAYSFTATNQSGVSRTQAFSIPILPDIVSFTQSPLENTEYSYIVSKQIDTITFSASSSANKPITSWALSLSTVGYGLSLSATSGSTVYLTGTPTNPLVQTSVTITATDSLGTIAVRTIKITIANDTFTWPTYAPTFIQNKPIETFQFQVSTSSGRQIQSYSATGLPAGITLSPAGLLSGTPTGSTGTSFIASATTGYVSPPTGSKEFFFTIIPDNILTVLNTSPTSVPFTGTSFSIANVFSAFSYSGFTSTNSIQAGSVSPVTSPPATFILVNNVLSGSIPVYQPSFTFVINGVNGSVTSSVTALLTLTNSPLAGTLTLPTSAGSLVFTQPTTRSYTLYQYCPMPTIPFLVSGASGYVYYYSISSNLPVGMTFTTETTGTSATLTGIPATYSATPSSVTVYAANGANVTFTTVDFRVLAPSFMSPRIGAAAYTASLKSDVEGNAAQNARDNRVFPQVDPLAGPLMAPRAPDVITMSNCFLGLCKKPCPTCHTMM